MANFFEFDLVAHRFDGFAVRADEDDAGFGERLRESRAFGQETVTRMDRLGARRLGRRDDLVDDEIGLRRRGRADGDRLVGHFDMQGVLVGLGIDGDGLDAHAARGLDDPAGDFAAIGDENFFEHRLPIRGKRARFGWGRSIGSSRARKQPPPAPQLAKGSIQGSWARLAPRPCFYGTAVVQTCSRTHDWVTRRAAPLQARGYRANERLRPA